jgi:hypothetical protein
MNADSGSFIICVHLRSSLPELPASVSPASLLKEKKYPTVSQELTNTRRLGQLFKGWMTSF